VAGGWTRHLALLPWRAVTATPARPYGPSPLPAPPASTRSTAPRLAAPGHRLPQRRCGRHTWAWTGRHGDWRLPDWPAAARDWDGVAPDRRRLPRHRRPRGSGLCARRSGRKAPAATDRDRVGSSALAPCGLRRAAARALPRHRPSRSAAVMPPSASLWRRPPSRRSSLEQTKITVKSAPACGLRVFAWRYAPLWTVILVRE
jgi:hypothetical protein